MRNYTGNWKRLTLAIVVLCLLCSITKAQIWTAYNDCAGTTGGNTTAYTLSGTTSGLLKDYATGANTTVTVTITKNGSINTYTSNGAYSNSGTDAYATFYGKANMVGVINYASSNGWYVDITLSGLDPTKTYTFATTANRDDDDYDDRNSEFTISGIESCTNASSSGVIVENNETVAFCTGYNTENGYVARWTNIAPGSDGIFMVRVNAYPFSSEHYGYGPSVFMLVEEDNTSPAIHTTGTLSNFASPAGTPSESQSYTVSGVNLTSDISISAPEGFEISTDDITYGPNLTLLQSGGTVSSTAVYVRLNSPDLGTYSGNISHTSTDAAQKDVAVNGTVAVYYSLTVNTDSRGNVELSPAGGSYASGTEVTLTATGNTGYTFNSWTGDLSGSANPALLTMDGNKTVTANFTEGGNESLVVLEDTWMRSSQPEQNFGGSTTIQVSPRNNYPQGSLYKWDVSGIPGDATVVSVSLTFNVTDGSAYAFSLYNMRRAWVEGTNDEEEGSGASWTYYGAGTGEWADEGAANTESDRYNVNLWDAVATDFGSTGLVTFPLNANGVAVVQEWINGTTSNYGLTIQNYSGGSSSDYWIVSSSEESVDAQRPRLNITYSTSSDPSITITGTLNDFTSAPGVPSTSQTYTVSGRHLTDVLNITAPTGFEISEDGTTFTSNLTLTPVDGVVTAKSIYVRMYSSYEASLSGNITHTSAGAIQKNMVVTGLVSSNISVSLEASEDNYMSSYNTTNNYGTSTTLKSTRNGSSNVKRGTLLRWDLSSIPATAMVTSASVTLYVSTSSSQTYNLYNMRHGWLEGTGASAETGDGATWLTYNGSDSWGSSGAADITTDRYDVNLWDAGTTSFSSAGTRTVNLNTEGLAVIQEWINGSVNNGLTIQNYSSSSINDDLQFASSENATNIGPTLNLTYSVATGITHTLTVTTDGHGNISLNPAGGVYTENSVITLTPVPNTGYEFSGWDGENDIDLVDNGNGTWSITMNEDKSLTAFFTETPTNDAPNEPTLMQPADNGTDVSTSPSLEITVSDPDVADMLDIIFYGREAGATTTSPDFSFVIIPDPQNFASTGTLYSNEMQWIANNRTDSNIVFVTCVGDLVNTSSSTSEYENADAAFDILDVAGVPYSVSPGNHDEGFGGTVLWPNYFGTSRFSGKSWFTEAYDNFNSCSFFSASGNDFIVINLEYSPGTAVLNWADGILKNNTTRRGIVVQHDILNTNNSWNNQASFTALKDNPNLFMMLCGHMHSGSDGAAYRAEPGDDGHTIHVIMADYQDFNTANYLRFLRFSPSEGMIYMTTYAPNNGSKLTTSPDQMNMVYAMSNGTSAPYELIGTDEDVANSANASITWPELLENTEYEWYATVSDGLLTTAGPVWSFTTGSISTNYILTMAVNGDGTTDPSVGTHSYPTGTVVAITANPSIGYQFVSWNGEVADPNSETTTVTMNASKTVTATFTEEEYTLTVNTVGSGAVSITPEQTTYNYDDLVMLTATPANGYSFAGWSGDLTGSENPVTIAVNGDMTLTATFTRDEYTLTTGVSGSGSVTRSPDQATYYYGDLVQLTATGSSGWTFSGWSGNLTGTDNPATITMDANKSVMATFTGTATTQEIELLGGWNIFSLNVTPTDVNIMSIVQPLIDNGSLVKVQDEAGNAIEYDPIEGEWINEIGNWKNTEGYKIRVNAAVTLNASGVPFSEPVNIDLSSGWNIVSYPATTSGETNVLLNSLLSSGNLIKVQDEQGNAIEMNPVTHNWIDDIITLDPGEGYKIRVSANENLVIDPSSIPEPTLKSTLKSASIRATSVHFKPNWTGNGLDHMNIYITALSEEDSGLEPGDEIGVFDGDCCVGSAVIQQNSQELPSVIASVDDPSTREIDGFIKGQNIRIKVWRPSENREFSLTNLNFSDRNSRTFEPQGTAVILMNRNTLGLDLSKCVTTGLGDIFPNPVHHVATIPFFLGAESTVDITIYNSLGERVCSLIHGTFPAGSYTTTWDLANQKNSIAVPGMYFCKMITGNEVFVKKLEVIDNR